MAADKRAAPPIRKIHLLVDEGEWDGSFGYACKNTMPRDWKAASTWKELDRVTCRGCLRAVETKDVNPIKDGRLIGRYGRYST